MEWFQGRKNDVPEELMREILVRLPVKSLVRFRCVHTSWNALFKTRSFVADHSSSQHERLMMFPNYFRCEMDEYDYAVIHSDDPSLEPCHRVPIPSEIFPSSSSHHDDEKEEEEEEDSTNKEKCLNLFVPITSSSCNGIFLIIFGTISMERHQLMLWNPATRDVKVVPPPHHLGDHCDLRYYRSFGFGVDRKTNDYKIVNLLLNPYGEANTITTEVYSLSTNSWVTTIHVDDVPDVTYLEDNPIDHNVASTHANGVCYWTCGRSAGILCFDLSNNKFKLISLPINFIDDLPSTVLRKRRPGEKKYYEYSFLVNDSIAYAIYHRDVNPNSGNISFFDRVEGLGVWVYKEEEGSWSRTHYIEPFDLDSQIYGFWKTTGEFLATTKRRWEQYLVSLDDDNEGMEGQTLVRKLHTEPPSVLVRNYVPTIAPLSL